MSAAAPVGDDLIDERAMSKLRWRCRRGLLENDLFIDRFFTKYEGNLTQRQAQGLLALMDLSDNDLLDLFFARQQPSEDLSSDEVVEVLKQLRETR
jgi:antitoxin CptB